MNWHFVLGVQMTLVILALSTQALAQGGKARARLSPNDHALVVRLEDSQHNRYVVPQVHLANASVAARINIHLLKSIFNSSLETTPRIWVAQPVMHQAGNEYKANGQVGIYSLDFKVLYNANSLLSFEVYSEFSGAYPWTSTSHVNYDLRTGQPVTINQLIADTASLRRYWQLAISRRVIKDMRTFSVDYPEADSNDIATVQDLLHWDYKAKKMHMEINEPGFADFAVTQTGLILYYDFGFPHAIQNMEPMPDFSFSNAELKRWLNPAGLLGLRH